MASLTETYKVTFDAEGYPYTLFAASNKYSIPTVVIPDTPFSGQALMSEKEGTITSFLNGNGPPPNVTVLDGKLAGIPGEAGCALAYIATYDAGNDLYKAATNHLDPGNCSQSPIYLEFPWDGSDIQSISMVVDAVGSSCYSNRDNTIEVDSGSGYGTPIKWGDCGDTEYTRTANGPFYNVIKIRLLAHRRRNYHYAYTRLKAITIVPLKSKAMEVETQYPVGTLKSVNARFMVEYTGSDHDGDEVTFKLETGNTEQVFTIPTLASGVWQQVSWTGSIADSSSTRASILHKPAVSGSATGIKFYLDELNVTVDYSDEVTPPSEPSDHETDASDDCQSHDGAADPASANPLRLRNGNKFLSEVDLTVPGHIQLLTFSRAYQQNKQGNTTFPQFNQTMGLGWIHNHRSRLRIDGTNAQVLQPGGGVVKLVETDPTGDPDHYDAKAGSTATLDKSGSEYVLTSPDHSATRFEDDPAVTGQVYRLKSHTWPDGTSWTYQYDTASPYALEEVSDGYRKLVFRYHTSGSHSGQLYRVGDHTFDDSGTLPSGRFVEFNYTLDASNQSLLTHVQDVRGKVWRYVYDSQNRLIQRLMPPTEDSLGQPISGSEHALETLTYGMNGANLQITQRRGLSDPANVNTALMKTIFEFKGTTTTETTEALGDDLVTTHTFTNGVYTGTSNPLNQSTAVGFNQQYRRTVIRDAKGNRTRLTWSSDGRHLTQTRDAEDNITKFDYDSTSGVLLETIDAEGRKTEYTYASPNTDRQPSEIQIRDQSNTLLRWRKFEYDSAKRKTCELTLDPADATGQTMLQKITHSYAATGNGAGLLEKTEQHDVNSGTGSIDCASTELHTVTTTYLHDEIGRVVQVNRLHDALSQECSKTRLVYDAADHIIAVIQHYDPPNPSIPPVDSIQAAALHDPSQPDQNQVTTHTYDPQGRRVESVRFAGSPQAQRIHFVYDALNRVTRTIANYVPQGTSEPQDWHWNAAVAPARWEDGNGTAIDFGTNRDQNMVSDLAYNERGLVKFQRDVLGRVTLFGYNTADRLVRQIVAVRPDAQNYNNSYATGDYDLSDYVPSSAPDQDIITVFEHDAVGNVIKNGHAFEAGQPLKDVNYVVYDRLNRPVKVVASASNPAYAIQSNLALTTYAYQSAADVDLVEEITYDRMGRVRSTKDVLGHTSLYGYDDMGLASAVLRNASNPAYNLDWNSGDPALTLPSGDYTVSTASDEDVLARSVYDPLGRVTAMIDPLAHESRFTYDGLSRPTERIINYEDGLFNPSELDRDLPEIQQYDDTCRVMWTQDPLGRKTWFAYDVMGRVIKSVVNAQGAGTTGGTDDPRSDSYIASTDTDKDLITTYQFDSAGNMVRAVDPAGNVSFLVYDLANRPVKSVRNAKASATLDLNPGDSGYAAANDPRSAGYAASSATDRDIITYMVYDEAGQVTETQDPRGTLTRFEYDGVGRPRSTVEAANTSLETVHYSCYDKFGNVLRSLQNYVPKRDKNGEVLSPDARLNGQWVFVPQHHGAYNDQNLVTAYTYDRANRLASATDPLGHTLAMTYFKDGQLQSMTDAMGMVTRYTYDKLRRRSRVIENYRNPGAIYTDPDTWQAIWNAGQGRYDWQDSNSVLIAHGTAQDENIVVQAEYDKDGRLVGMRNPRGYLSAFRYDRLGRPVAEVTNYVPQGSSDPATWFWNSSTSLWLRSATDSTPIAHGTNGDENLFITQRRYTGLENSGLPTGETQLGLRKPDGVEIAQTFDLAARPRALTYGAPAVTPDVAFDYDRLGNLTRMAEYDAPGFNPANLVRETLYQFDAASRLSQTSFDDTTTVDTIGYAYDRAGLRTRMTLPGNLDVDYTYDAKGQLNTLTDWDAQQTTFIQDAVGRTISTQRPNGLRSRYHYDAASRLHRLRHTVGNQAYAHFAYEVDARGNRTQAVELFQQPAVPADITLTATDPSIAYKGDWTDDGAFKVTDSPSASLMTMFYGTDIEFTFGTGPDHGLFDVYIGKTLYQSYDGYNPTPDERTVQVTLDGEGPFLFEIRNRPERNLAASGQRLRFRQLLIHDQAYELHTATYEYDGLQRVQRVRYAPNRNTGATPLRNYDYDYDRAGNWRSEALTLNGGTPIVTNRTYNAANQINGLSYDANGNLTSDGVSSFTWDQANRLVSSGGLNYRYDGLSRRTQQSTGSLNTSYLLDVQAGLPLVVAERTGSTTRRFVHGPYGLHAQAETSGDWSWPLQDGLGSVRGLMSDTPSMLGYQHYAPYGTPFGLQGTLATPYGFTGEMQDSNNLLYLRARYYAPGLNSFTSRDSFRGMMTVPMSLNGYSYAHNNPANLTDPGGHFPPLILAALTGALFGAAIGSVLGGVSETVSQLSNNGWNFNCLVQKDIADAILEGMLLGALSGAVGGAFGYLKLAGAAAWAAGEAIDFAGGYLWDVHINGYSHQEAFINNLLGFGMGGLIGLIGHGVGRALRPVLRNMDGFLPNLRRYVNPDANAPRVRCNSFSADTLVTTPDGNVAISKLKLDDLVLAYDEASGEVSAYRVLDIHTHTDEIVVKLTIDGEVIQTTPEHPFFTVERGWIPAGALEVGDRVYAADLTVGVIEAVQTVAEPQVMVNLTVETVHTFAVGDGQWVVHNSDYLCGFAPEVEAFITDNKLPRGDAQDLQSLVNQMSGGIEKQYIDDPLMLAADLTDRHIAALLSNQAGHMDITLRNLITRIVNNNPKALNSLTGIKNQLGLGRYRFLNHPTNPRLIQGREMEFLALQHPDLPAGIRQELLTILNNTLSFYK